MEFEGKSFARAERFICKLRGGSQPILVEDTDGLLYVLKFASNLQGANVPFNESVGSDLFKACGLAVAPWKSVLVTNSFLDRNPGCWIETPDGVHRPDTGLCFGSRFLGTRGKRLREILPGTSYKRISNRISFWLAWLIDVCCDHADNRQAVFHEDTREMLHAYFIDMGHLFGGPKGEERPCFLASRYLDPRIYVDITSKEAAEILRTIGSLNSCKLWRRAQALPPEWRSASAARALQQSFDRLGNRDWVKMTLEVILDSRLQRGKSGQSTPWIEGETRRPLLYSGIPPKPVSKPRSLAGQAGYLNRD
ncbi:MAG: hypothetical protein ACLGRW_02975 [Acidobacteriota bacterium]